MAICTIAQKRLASGLRLNLPEAEALIAGQVLHLARSNRFSVAQMMAAGRTMLGTKQVLAGVAGAIEDVQVEANFLDGTKLVAVVNPICMEHGNLALALEGSFLPVPALSLFDAPDPEEGLVLGEVVCLPDKEFPLLLNKGREIVTLSVFNTG